MKLGGIIKVSHKNFRASVFIFMDKSFGHFEVSYQFHPGENCAL